MKRRAEEFVFGDEADLGVFSDTPISIPLLGEAEVPAEASSSLSPARASTSNLHGLEARTTKAARSSTSNI